MADKASHTLFRKATFLQDKQLSQGAQRWAPDEPVRAAGVENSRKTSVGSVYVADDPAGGEITAGWRRTGGTPRCR